MFYIITFKEKTEKVRYVLVQNINQQNVGKKKKSLALFRAPSRAGREGGAPR